MADILVVEDDADLAAAIGDLLALEGHTPRIALDGASGLRAMRVRLPDLILLDIEMPVLDGPGMAHALLAEDAGRELVPIIVSSGYADLDRVADALGTPYRIPKPSSVERLLQLVSRALEERCAPQPERQPERRKTG
jgi:DNA-binding NtrC family response regulator